MFPVPLTCSFIAGSFATKCYPLIVRFGFWSFILILVSCTQGQVTQGLARGGNGDLVRALDTDQDGLIEIQTLEELACLHKDLDGDGKDDNDDSNLYAARIGSCPNSGCVGYELNRSLDFADADSYSHPAINMNLWTNVPGGSKGSWRPLGSCSDHLCDAYSGIFNGNGHTLSNLFINASAEISGVGLFAAMNGTVINFNMENITVHGGNRYVGTLAGFASGILIENVTVARIRVSGMSAADVGGLIGKGDHATVTSVWLAGVEMTGNRSVAGLMGYGDDAKISMAYVEGVSVRGKENLGGLVGGGSGTEIAASFVSADYLIGDDDNIGGLIGRGQSAQIAASYAVGGRITGNARVGGLVGSGFNTTVTASYAAIGPIYAASDSGGLIGSVTNGGRQLARINFSYWDGQMTRLAESPGGGQRMGGQRMRQEVVLKGIYKNWKPFWCDPTKHFFTSDSEHPLATADNLAWDLGNSYQYPALRCSLHDDETYQRHPADSPVDHLTLDRINRTLVLNWKNPPGEIAYFNITLQKEGGGERYFIKDDQTPSRGESTYLIENLSESGFYRVRVILVSTNGARYPFNTDRVFIDADGDDDGFDDAADNCPLVANTNQTNTDGAADGGDACDPDDDDDGFKDVADNCRLVANTNQTNTDGAADGGDACDPDDDNDGVEDVTDVFSLDPCASVDTDGDGRPDQLVANCTTDLTEDPDDDDDGFPDEANRTTRADNCQFTANPDQANHDSDALGDLCDPDDDNDGFEDVADNCPLVANTNQTNTDGAADGGDACDPDDDNDGVEDVTDVFSLDPCASVDTDGDGRPDQLVANCTTDLTEDPDDDDDGFPDEANRTTRADNCPLVANANQTNTDGAADGGDACDPDDDNDGLDDLADNCQFVSNPGQTNTDGANDGGDACDPDDDNDGIEDTADHDRDGDGLIEIHFLEDLAALRDDLNADGEDDGNLPDVGENRSAGCPVGVGGCFGYELARSLNFDEPSSYADPLNNIPLWTRTGSDGRGWTPIGAIDRTGSCAGSDSCPFYDGVFEGNHHSISNLYLNASDESLWVGLFAAIGDSLQSGVLNLQEVPPNGGLVRNLKITNASIFGGSRHVGILAGHARGLRLFNVAVRGGTVLSPLAQRVGGLAGFGFFSRSNAVSFSDGVIVGREKVGGLFGDGAIFINNSYVSNANLSGQADIGGLVGGYEEGMHFTFKESFVIASYVANVSLTGGSRLGGIAGYSSDISLISSFARGISLRGENKIGGLVGDAINTRLFGSFARVDRLIGANRSVGGLVGEANGVRIKASYALGGPVRANSFVGGLVGAVLNNVDIHSSYAALGPLSGQMDVGGLVGTQTGDARPVQVYSSYWDREVTGQDVSAGEGGEGKTGDELKRPTEFSGGIYADWANFWCDPTDGLFTNTDDDTARTTAAYRAWDLGDSDAYPTLTCVRNPGEVRSP